MILYERDIDLMTWFYPQLLGSTGNNQVIVNS